MTIICKLSRHKRLACPLKQTPTVMSMNHFQPPRIIIHPVLVLAVASLVCSFTPASAYSSAPFNCSDTTSVCESLIAYKLQSTDTLSKVQSLFDVTLAELTFDQSSAVKAQYAFVNKSCGCFQTKKQYLTTTTYTVTNNDGYLAPMVESAYEGLAQLPNASRIAHMGAVVTVYLLCGCSSDASNYLMSYVLQDMDTLSSIASRFGVSMQDIETVNNITDPNVLSTGKVYYIPLNSVPGVPYHKEEEISPTPSPVAAPLKEFSKNTKSRLFWGCLLGLIGIALVLILTASLVYALRHKFVCFQQEKNSTSNSAGHDVEKAHFLCTIKSQLFMGSCFCCHGVKNGPTDLNDEEPTVTKDLMTRNFNADKPIMFTYKEVLAVTNNFKDSELLGKGGFASVYYGILRDQEVAIKRMKATKTKEFQVEMKVLCKVHHTNLVELIGFAASDDELFLVYEYAHNSSVCTRLHDPLSKGYAPLSWNTRVQIALDAAKGLEYLHEHTNPHYVHRDIKTSNILLDNNFRAKISDFGLAKLVGKTGEGEPSVTKVVGTFGYLAPEYLRDGQATSKSDVYAFGVVLFELISGKEPIAKNKGLLPTAPERRSLISIMLSALRSSPNSTQMNSLKECIDCNLMDLYPYDCVYKMAILAKQCVEEDPILRPDMKQVVVTLSQILLSSMEWESSLAGNSQVFSGLKHGR
ncbi:hypothetical protein SUGI_1134910 [Cryptomeria japonica]|uniref:lysM domain receptor-like kinase 3 n=1 Tax=Cryptomeria japonica TaxID=3369 RepID=UPI0024146C7D|nr:lysM domain receptor-like kinase 3 [Cryptomeria japonica]GLJ53251.1 hypothetical protein SUGI_1134910 [Cryptomeria japonica]